MGIDSLLNHSESIPMGIMSRGGICLPVTPVKAECKRVLLKQRRGAKGGNCMVCILYICQIARAALVSPAA